VAEADAQRVDIVDLRTATIVASVAMPARPSGVAFDGRRNMLYVTCDGPAGTVCALDTASTKIAWTRAVGHGPRAPAVHPDGHCLYLCNRFDNTVSALDLTSQKELFHVAAVCEPCAAAITPDGKRLFVLNHLPNERADGDTVAAAITIVDTDTHATTHVRLRDGSTGLRDACVSPDGRYLYLVHTLARHHLPATRVEGGWMNANALSILDARTPKLLATVLLDEPLCGAANPWAVACSADGTWICVAHAGTHELSRIDAPRLWHRLAEARPSAASEDNGPGPYSFAVVVPDVPDEVARLYAKLARPEIDEDPTFLAGLRRRVSLPGQGPRSVVTVGSKAYVAQYFSDELAAVNLADGTVDSIRLGSPPRPTPQRRGEMLFHDGTICRQHWQSCATCHPDGRADGSNWDLLNDGLGNPKNTKSLLLAHASPPAMWSGVRPSAAAAVREGLRHVLFAEVPEEDARAIDDYLMSLQPIRSPHLVDGRPSASAQRGRQLFLSREIGCAGCHPPPLYTDLHAHGVGSEAPFDRQSEFDTPSLVECWRTMPYFHDGRYPTLKDVLLDKHGLAPPRQVQLDDTQVRDLVEFLLAL
jgi:mono/diheme cytochrome c family protein